jgi:hypothetical protein
VTELRSPIPVEVDGRRGLAVAFVGREHWTVIDKESGNVSVVHISKIKVQNVYVTGGYHEPGGTLPGSVTR